MVRRLCVFVTLAVAPLACETVPPGPSVILAPSIPAVATAEPYRWDTRDELAAWVNGSTIGSAEVVDDAADALIRIHISAGDAILHGPDCNPPPPDVQSARLRYRWTGRADGDGIIFLLHLRPMEFDEDTRIPSLQPRGAYNQSVERAGGWTERTLAADSGFTPPFMVRFAALRVDGIGISGTRSTPTANCIVEIDWIDLVR